MKAKNNSEIGFEQKTQQPQDLDYFQYQDSIVNANKAEDTEIQTERNLPWIVDIFLYPISKPGLVMLGILMGIPLFLSILSELTKIAVISFPPLIVVLIALGFIRFIVELIIAFYGYWYICECIRDSAGGSVRAPETIGNTPGLWELIRQFFQTLSCLILFAGPAAVYFWNVRSADGVFWALVIISGFFFPMALLAVIMFDSLRSLNPFLIITSVLSTLIPYCCFVLFAFATGWVFVRLISFVGRYQYLSYFAALMSIYFLMVEAHLLGRFYWRYQEKLYWEV